jgi:type II secretory pathway component PulK
MSDINWHKILRRLKILLQVLGYLVLGLGACIALAALLQDELSTARPRLLNLASKYAVAGLALLVVHFLIFTLPHWIQMRRSPTHQRRRALGRNQLGTADRDPRRGGVLVLVLVLLSLLSVLLVQAHALARHRLRAEENARATADVRRAATDAVWAALQRLADDPDLTVDTTNEIWAAREEVTTPLGISTLTRVWDSSSRFDLNNLSVVPASGERASEDILMDVMTLCGDFTPVARVSALRDFVDTNPAGLYEAAHYARRTPPESCPNRILYTWGELLATEGWTREAFARKPRTGALRTFEADLVDNLTLIPVPREKPLPVNINTASRETLTGVLGLGQDALVATILTLRSLKPIRDLEAIALMAEPGVFEAVRPFLAVRSDWFEIEALAFADGRSERVRARAARTREGRVDVVQWLF